MARPLKPGNYSHAELRALFREHQGDGFLSVAELVAKLPKHTVTDKARSAMIIAASGMAKTGKLLIEDLKVKQGRRYRLPDLIDKLQAAAVTQPAPAFKFVEPGKPVELERWPGASFAPLLDLLVERVAAAVVTKLGVTQGATLPQVAALVNASIDSLEQRLLAHFGGPAAVTPEPSPAPKPLVVEVKRKPRVLIYRVQKHLGEHLTAGYYAHLRVEAHSDFSSDQSVAARLAKAQWDEVILITRAIGHAEREAFVAAGHRPIMISTSAGLEEVLTGLSAQLNGGTV